jgi:NADPH:quinone reductase-like Zn-dependent oxidoreductase
MATMKAVRLHAYGGPEVLVYEDAPVPEPGAGEVRIRVRAAGVNPFDWKVRSGHMKQFLPLALPAVLGGDVAGVVELLGEGVTAFAVGDEVFGDAVFSKAGAYAELAISRADAIAAKPKSLDFDHAASVPTPALTAWQALFAAGGLGAGQTVLLHGMGGAVGRLALQFAKEAGARVLGTASAADREELLRLGADAVIDYRSARFEDVAAGVNLVIDTVGGETQARSFAVLAKGGMLVSLVQPPSEELAKQHGVRAQFMSKQPRKSELEQITARLDEGKLTLAPIVIVPLAEAARAHAMGEGGKAKKMVLHVPG